MWNPLSYSNPHQNAEDLIILAATHHLTLRSELGIPTFYALSDKISNTTIDLVWKNKEACELATSCITDVSLEHSHLLDHAAILTSIDLPHHSDPIHPSTPRLNWKKADEASLALSLISQLTPLSQPASHLSSKDDLQEYVKRVTDAINMLITEHVPFAKNPPNARRWWSEAVLGPMEQKTSALRRKYQLYKLEDNKQAYLLSEKTYHLNILRLKHEHWKSYLLELDDKSLFSAARFTNGLTPPSFIPPLCLQDGQLTTDPTRQASLLFAGTSAPTIDIDLSDITDPAPRT